MQSDQGQKKVRGPTVESLVRGLWMLRLSESIRSYLLGVSHRDAGIGLGISFPFLRLLEHGQLTYLQNWMFCFICLRSVSWHTCETDFLACPIHDLPHLSLHPLCLSRLHWVGCVEFRQQWYMLWPVRQVSSWTLMTQKSHRITSGRIRQSKYFDTSSKHVTIINHKLV